MVQMTQSVRAVLDKTIFHEGGDRIADGYLETTISVLEDRKWRL